MERCDKKVLLNALSKEGFEIVNGIPYTKCFYCGKNIELQINGFDDPDGEFFAFCGCGFHIDYHAKDPWYFKKYDRRE